MGDASNTRLAIAAETTFGVNPGSGFAFLRFSSEGLKHAQAVIESDEIDPTRQPPGALRVNRSAEGQISCEDSLITPAATPYSGFDILIAGAMMSTWSTIIALTGRSIDISGAAGGAFTLTDAASANAFTNASDGQWLKLGGFDTNGTIWAHITTKTSANVVVCEGVRDGGAAVTNEAGQTDITVAGSMIRIGGTRNSFTIEKQFTDLTADEYSLATGLLVGQWGWQVTPQQAMRHTWTMLGQALNTTTSSGAGSPTAKWATGRLTAPFDYEMKMEAVFTALATHRIAEVSFNLDNRPRLDFEVGSETPQVGIGTPRLTGQFNTFMDDATLQRKLEANTASKLAFRLNDGTRQRIVTFPAIKYTDGGGFAGGNDQAVVQTLSWAAEADSEGVAMQIDRY